MYLRGLDVHLQFALALIGQHGQKHLDVVQPQITRVDHAHCLSGNRVDKINIKALNFHGLKLY